MVCSTHLSEERSPPLLPRPLPGERGGGRRRGGRQHPARPAQRLPRPGGGRGPRGPGAGPAGAPGQPAQRGRDWVRSTNTHLGPHVGGGVVPVQVDTFLLRSVFYCIGL